MATQSQIEANRNNAKQSTGPRTQAGKQRSSRNALKHGLRAEQSVIPGEDPADFERHLTEFDDTFHPNTAYERALVRQMADAEWRLQRISRLEAAFLSSAFDRANVSPMEPRDLAQGLLRKFSHPPSLRTPFKQQENQAAEFNSSTQM